jgi:hypothetical protein
MTYDPVQERTIAINQRYGFLKLLTHDGVVSWIEVTLGRHVFAPRLHTKTQLIKMALEIEYGKEDVRKARVL